LGKFKIWVYAISKNEEKYVDAWVDSMKEADGILVVDTGSTDNTVKKLKELGVTVHEHTFVPWRFDAARNKALDLLPDDVHICISTDLDEVLVAGWRDKLEKQWKDDTTRGHFIYNYSLDENDKPLLQFQREKIHSRHDYHWFSPVHERLEYIGDGDENGVFLKDVVLNHYPDNNKPRTQYLPLLELAVEENPNDAQGTFWLGREYTFYGKHKEAIDTLKKYLNLDNAKGLEERAAAARLIGQSYKLTGDNLNALNWFYRAIGECNTSREPFKAIVEFGYEEQNWHLVYAMSQQALAIKFKSGSYLVDESCWGNYFDDMASISAYYLGLTENSLHHAKQALRYESNAFETARLKNNLKMIEEKLEETRGAS